MEGSIQLQNQGFRGGIKNMLKGSAKCYISIANPLFGAGTGAFSTGLFTNPVENLFAATRPTTRETALLKLTV